MKKIVALMFLALFVTIIWPERVVQKFDMPLYAAQNDEHGKRLIMTFDKGLDLPWLHVVVETKYAWLYQKSVGRAWVTVSRDDSTRTNVGELCIQLDCYGQHKICERDTSYLEIQEIKRRVAVKKKKAIVSAWANDPALEKITVEMEP